MRILLLLFFIVCGVSGASGAEVTTLFQQPFPVWGMAMENFPSGWLEEVVTWSDEKKQQLHYYYRETDAALTVAEMPVMEAELLFPQGKLARMELILFSEDEPFNEGLSPEEVGNYLNGYIGISPLRMREIQLGQIAFHVADWPLGEGQLSMVWALRGDEVTYMKLMLTPKEADWIASLAVPVTLAQLERGQARLMLPASRQGERQYCTAATVERIFRYYQSSMDQHLLAALFGVDVDAGAQVPELLASLNSLSSQLQMRPKMIYANPDYVNYEAILRFFNGYNAWAKKLSQPPFNTDRIRRMSGERGREALTRGLGELNRDVLLQMRSGNQEAKLRFRRDIGRYIDRGVPLMWTALAKGGDKLVAFHMMLIQGFDKENDMVIYSDSADPAGGRKKMPLLEAWAITNHLAVLLPASVPEDSDPPLLPEAPALSPPATPQ